MFEWPEWITVNGFRVAFGGQELGVAAVQQNHAAAVGTDARVSLILATPGGCHVFWDAKDLGTSVAEPPLQPPPPK